MTVRVGARAGVALAIVLAAATPAAAKSKAAADDDPDLSGTYTITSGKLPNGNAYEGTLAIAPRTRMGGKHGTVLWDAVWTVSSAPDPVRGVGIFLNGAFIVAYGPADGYGLSVYLKIRRGGHADWMLPDDTIQGFWFRPDGTSGREGLRGDLDAWTGDYRMHGHTDAGGDTTHLYSGNLAVTPSGEIVRLRWSGRNKKGRDKGFDYGGIGLPVPGFLAAQWSFSGGGGVGVYLFDGGSMTGLFAEDGGVGQETLAVPSDVAERVAAYLAR